MRGITYVQAFQYWLKTFAIALPACLLLLHLGGLPERAAMFGREFPQAPAGGLRVTLDAPQPVTFPEAGTVVADGVRVAATAGEERVLPAGEVLVPAGMAVPVAEGTDAQRGEEWARPISRTGDASPVFVYSLLLATFLGTMGLPHILVRFYTNRDGPAARRTTVRVLGLLGCFYAFPAVYGALGRVLVPELYLTGDTDTVVLRLPEAAWPGPAGELLGALVAAGAFAAFLSTASGLLVSLAGTISYDLARTRGPAVRRRRFRLAALGAMVVPAALARRRPRARHLRARRLGVRARRLHLLPAAAARDLVGRPDGARGGRRAPGRRGVRDRRHLHRARLRTGAPVARCGPHPAGHRLRARGLRGHGGRVAPRPARAPAARRRAARAPCPEGLGLGLEEAVAPAR
jgi:Sodium:solute symporter family